MIAFQQWSCQVKSITLFSVWMLQGKTTHFKSIQRHKHTLGGYITVYLSPAYFVLAEHRTGQSSHIMLQAALFAHLLFQRDWPTKLPFS